MGERHFGRNRDRKAGRRRGQRHVHWPTPVYDPNDRECRTPDDVRRKYPRTHCACGAICYASFTHYIAGDW